MALLGGLFNNFSEESLPELTKQYGAYLMPEETIQTGLKLVRDSMIITNERLILIDHQGVTGTKSKVSSIHLNSIFEVTLETAGIGFDDSEITIHYITSPYHRSNNVQTAVHKFEISKKSNVQAIYVALVTVAHQNSVRINS